MPTGPGEAQIPSSKRNYVILAGCLACLIFYCVALFTLNRSRESAALEHAFWIVGHASYTAPQRQEAFLQLIAAGNREWRGAQVAALHFDGVTFPQVFLKEIDFTGGSFCRSVFARAQLGGAKLANTDLSDSDFSEGDLAGANLFKAQLARAHFRQASLRGAVLEQVAASNAVFLGAELGEAQCLMGNFSGANFTSANLTCASLEAAVLRGANLTFALMAGVDLKDADLTDANWWRARQLTSSQINWLAKRFPPSTNAPKAWQDDFAEWQTVYQKAIGVEPEK